MRPSRGQSHRCGGVLPLTACGKSIGVSTSPQARMCGDAPHPEFARREPEFRLSPQVRRGDGCGQERLHCLPQGAIAESMRRMFNSRLLGHPPSVTLETWCLKA